MDIVTTIQTPATPPVRLTTKEHARGDLKITTGEDDIYLDRLIDSQSEQVIRYCGRTFAVETIKDVFWLRHGRRDDRLQLSRYPVTAITSVTENDGVTDTVLAANTDYISDALIGQLLRIDSTTLLTRCWRCAKVTAIYAAGYTLPTQTKTGESYTLPRSLEEAVIRLVKLRYLERTRDPLVMSENIPGVIDRRYWVDTKSDGNLPPDIREVLDQFRVPTFA